MLTRLPATMSWSWGLSSHLIRHPLPWLILAPLPRCDMSTHLPPSQCCIHKRADTSPWFQCTEKLHDQHAAAVTTTTYYHPSLFVSSLRGAAAFPGLSGGHHLHLHTMGGMSPRTPFLHEPKSEFASRACALHPAGHGPSGLHMALRVWKHLVALPWSSQVQPAIAKIATFDKTITWLCLNIVAAKPPHHVILS